MKCTCPPGTLHYGRDINDLTKFFCPTRNKMILANDMQRVYKSKPDFEHVLPADPTDRKRIPLQTGLFDYFPAALCAVAELSKIGNDQHNPGEPLHWSRHLSSDHGDTLLRHQMQHGFRDADTVRHSTKVAWRALAQLQLELEAAHDE